MRHYLDPSPHKREGSRLQILHDKYTFPSFPPSTSSLINQKTVQAQGSKCYKGQECHNAFLSQPDSVLSLESCTSGLLVQVSFSPSPKQVCVSQAAETLAREPAWLEAWAAFAFALETAGGGVHSLTASRLWNPACRGACRRESPQAWLGKAKLKLFTARRYKS